MFRHLARIPKWRAALFQARTRPSRSHNRMLIPPIARDGIRGLQYNSFYYRSVTTWNNLPKDVPIAPSVYSFKRRLDLATFFPKPVVLVSFSCAVQHCAVNFVSHI